MNSFESPDSPQFPDEYTWFMGCESENDTLERQKLKYYAQRTFNLIFCDENNIMTEGGVVSLEHQCEPRDCHSHDRSSGIVSTPVQSCDEEIRTVVDVEPNDLNVGCKGGKRRVFPSASFASFRLLTNCVSRRADQKLSTNAIICLAGDKFVQSKGRHEEMLIGGHLSSGTFSGLTKENRRDAELVFYLLASAEKIGEKQFDNARKLLEHCNELSYYAGNSIQRLGYYFSEALSKKINKEMGRTSSKNLGKSNLSALEDAMMGPNPTIIAYHKAIPMNHIIHFAGIQSIVEHVAGARKIHIIDLSIRDGNQHTISMQALAKRSERSVKCLRITAIGTKSKKKIEESGRRLKSFAQSLKLPFTFNILMVDDILDLKEELLLIDSDEAVAVFSKHFLWNMLGQTERLESLMRVIKVIKPRVMIVSEVEANHNSPVFVNRFLETLFYYGAEFDVLEDCMKNDELNRLNLEAFYFSKSIHSIISAEGEERTFRHVKIEVWRAFFARFGMMETEFSMSSIQQVNLVPKSPPYSSSCTLDKDGKSLIIGWKETPLHSLSAWRFMY
ncbi:hypothetical protein LIER_00606 [Lithospermum erythrorhizon]|uniref:DELLA protein RGL1 n=1 Tax=Lithospermum erythrorhizon TaxID=34254 RepID=A0AAV3NJ89_LITER